MPLHLGTRTHGNVDYEHVPMGRDADVSRTRHEIDERVATFVEHWSMGSQCDRTDATLLLSAPGSALTMLLARKAILRDLAGAHTSESPWYDHLHDVRERLKHAALSFGREAIAHGLSQRAMLSSLHALPFWMLATHGSWAPLVDYWASEAYASPLPTSGAANATNQEK